MVLGKVIMKAQIFLNTSILEQARRLWNSLACHWENLMLVVELDCNVER